MYTLHIYITVYGALHIITNKREYIQIVNTSKFFLSKLEEQKSRIYCIKATNSSGEAATVLGSSNRRFSWGSCSLSNQENQQNITDDEALLS